VLYPLVFNIAAVICALIWTAVDTNMKSAAPEVWLYQDRINNATEFNVWMAFHQATPAATPPQ
jgi:hypothetical protein